MGDDSMTGDTFPRSWPGRLIEIAKIIGAVSIIVSAAIGVWAGTVGPAKQLYDVAVQFIDDFERLQADVEQLKDDVARANGEDRVIRQPDGLSYIREPVRVGEPVVMIMVAARTKLGADCRLTEWVPIFTDELNIPTPGRRAMAGPVRRQIGSDLQTLRIEMIPPERLRPGRITVYLTLTYECPSATGATTLQDRTMSLPYRLLPAG